jgi:hypothetical protein
VSDLATKLGLVNVHAESACVGPCPLHKPSEHHMSSWPLVWRGDRRIFERTCPHRVGHPDPDSLQHAVEYHEDTVAGVHGCDGCCSGSSRTVGQVNG